ncbi:MAG: thioredoxin family protein [Bacteroidetes bacterium]|nr:thioredoxin family protein [Bacteroidota bacterium]
MGVQAQDKVTVEAKASWQKNAIQISGRLPKGTCLYLSNPDSSFHLEPVFSFTDSLVRMSVKPEHRGKEQLISDVNFEGKQLRVACDSFQLILPLKIEGVLPAQIRGSFQFYYGASGEYNPGSIDFTVNTGGGIARHFPILKPSIDIHNAGANCGERTVQDHSYTSVFLLGLLGGLIALLTPCVFPLIPLTVSFFTKKSGSNKKAFRASFTYGFFILLIYVLLSIPFHLLDQVNPEILNNISTNSWLNLLFFVVFVIFALSFFGLFEITLPSRFAVEADAKSGLKSVGGIFFMALTLAIVSFSCTGPILGSLLAGALTKEGGAWQLTAGMGGFGLGLALPFALFALFPQWLQSLPKSGGWLNTVKIVLGFLELGMAVKFLSNADLVAQWGLLKREVFIGIWVLIALALSLYLWGWIRFAHEGEKKSIPLGRKLFSLLAIILTLYLIPGVTNSSYANLSLLSGFPPPLCYSIYKEPVNCRHEQEPLKDYDTALALARKLNKPLLIDFTGWACVNCRRMEEQVWTNPEVQRLMQEEMVVVSLYVDERKKLPADQQQTYVNRLGQKKEIITVGDLWATFQSENFEAVAQPQYALLDTEEKLLSGTQTYTPDATIFKEWLECGLSTFKQR